MILYYAAIAIGREDEADFKTLENKLKKRRKF